MTWMKWGTPMTQETSRSLGMFVWFMKDVLKMTKEWMLARLKKLESNSLTHKKQSAFNLYMVNQFLRGSEAVAATWGWNQRDILKT